MFVQGRFWSARKQRSKEKSLLKPCFCFKLTWPCAPQLVPRPSPLICAQCFFARQIWPFLCPLLIFAKRRRFDKTLTTFQVIALGSRTWCWNFSYKLSNKCWDVGWENLKMQSLSPSISLFLLDTLRWIKSLHIDPSCKTGRQESQSKPWLVHHHALKKI